MSKICVLIPIFNEAPAIGTVVQSVRGRNLDVVVIDDGSTDNSGTIACQAGAVVIRHATKQGKGYSLRDGFRYVLEHDYTTIITMDGDGQHDVGDIDQFLLESTKPGRHPGIIVGNRMANPRGMPPLRYWTNYLMSFLISIACRQRIPDTQCGYRYIERRVLEDVVLSCDDFEIETEILMKAAKKGIVIASVPVLTIYRDEESKIHPLKDTIRFIRYFGKEICSSIFCQARGNSSKENCCHDDDNRS